MGFLARELPAEVPHADADSFYWLPTDPMYTTPRPPEERQALPVEGAIACLRFATTRLTDFSLRVADGERPVREYGRFLARLEAIENGALDGCFAVLGS